MHMLPDSPVFEWRISCLLTCDIEGKCRKKRRKKNKRKNPPVRIQLIVTWQNSSIHFLLTTTYFWSWSQGTAVCPWGRGRNTVWTVYQSGTSWVIYYNIGVQFITLPRISNKQSIWRYWTCLLISRYGKPEINSILKRNHHIASSLYSPSVTGQQRSVWTAQQPLKQLMQLLTHLGEPQEREALHSIHVRSSDSVLFDELEDLGFLLIKSLSQKKPRKPRNTYGSPAEATNEQRAAWAVLNIT